MRRVNTQQVVALSALAGLSGCNGTLTNTMDGKLDSRVDGTINSKIDGRLDTALKIEGPLVLQMQGPTIRYEGTYISEELVERAKVDKTTGEWILAVFGEPDVRTPLSDGSEIWRWTYRPMEQQRSMLSVFDVKAKEPALSTRTVFVQIRGGMVVDKWAG